MTNSAEEPPRDEPTPSGVGPEPGAPEPGAPESGADEPTPPRPANRRQMPASPRSPGDPEGWVPEDLSSYSDAPPEPIDTTHLDPGDPIPVSEGEREVETRKAAFAHWGAIFLGWIAGVVVILWHPANAGRYQEVHAKESLNFSIVMLLGYLVGVMFTPLLIGLFMLLAVYGFDIWNRVKASRAAEAGQMPGYWMPFRVLGPR